MDITADAVPATRGKLIHNVMTKQAVNACNKDSHCLSDPVHLFAAKQENDPHIRTDDPSEAYVL